MVQCSLYLTNSSVGCSAQKSNVLLNCNIIIFQCRALVEGTETKLVKRGQFDYYSLYEFFGNGIHCRGQFIFQFAKFESVANMSML